MNLKDFLYGQAQNILKRWSRSGIEDFLRQCLNDTTSERRKILVIGGYGRVISFINREFHNHEITTLDINPDFKADITADLASPELLKKIDSKFDAILIVEVLEHIPDFTSAISNTNRLLNRGGVLIGTTPWSTPLHDKPFDFYRYTYFQLQEMLLKQGYERVQLECRGNLLDSIVYLGLRGLKSWGAKGKLMFLLFAPISILMRKPKRYTEVQDACIGYNFVAYKKHYD